MDRNQAYDILSDLITLGFKTFKANVAGVPIVFKSVNLKELYLIRLSASEGDAMFDLFYLAYSVFMVCGESVLQYPDRKIIELCEFFGGLSVQLVNSLISQLNEMYQDCDKAHKYIEGFCYTQHAQHMWEALHGRLPNCVECTGIAGTERLGLNQQQEYWINLNRQMADEEEYDRQFKFALLVASSNNPKGTRSLRAKYEATRNETKDYQKRIALEGFAKSAVEWDPNGWAVPVDTAEELVEELERQMAGKKDRHDLFIEAHIKQIQDEIADKDREQRRKYEESKKNIPDLDGFQRILTPDEMKSRFNRVGSKILTRNS